MNDMTEEQKTFYHAGIEAAAKRLEGQTEGGHCGEGGMEIIARQRRNAWLKEAASIVRAAL